MLLFALLSPTVEAPAQPVSLPGLTVTLAWNANEETNIDGYRVYFGFRAGAYLRQIDVGNVTAAVVNLPLESMKYHFAVTAYDTDGLESDYSKEVTYDAPAGEVPIPTVPKTITTFEDADVLLDLLQSPLPGQESDWIVTHPPSEGFIVSRDGVVLYVPDPDFFGTDFFEVVIGLNASLPVRLAWEITLLPEDDPPLAFDAWVTTETGAPVPIGLAGFDAENGALSFELVTLPSSGTLDGTPPQLVYTPAPHFRGGDFFTFRVSDGSLTSLVAEVRIDVEPAFDGPLIYDQIFSMREDEVLPFRLDVVLESDLAMTITESPVFGTLTGTPPDLVYEPFPDFFGTDTMMIEVVDGEGRTEIAVVFFDVVIVNDPPAIAPFQLKVDPGDYVDFELTGHDVDGDLLRFEIVQEPTKGMLSGDPPRLTYRPFSGQDGTDTFSFRASDGTVTTEPELVTVTLGPPLSTPPAIEVQWGISGILTLRWDTIPGHSYQVMFRESLQAREWIPLTEALRAQSERLVWTDTLRSNAPSGFYSIRVLGP